MLCLSLVVMRCQPLRRALCLIHKNQQVVIVDSFGISFRFCRQFNI
ncbi:disulfide bond formation protein DsbD, partial [Vibrio cholerae]